MQSEKQRALRTLVFPSTCSSQSLWSRKGAWLQVLNLAVPAGVELGPRSHDSPDLGSLLVAVAGAGAGGGRGDLGGCVSVRTPGAGTSWGHCSQEEGSRCLRKLPLFALRVSEKHAFIEEGGGRSLFLLCPQLPAQAKTGDRKSRKPGRKGMSRRLRWGQEKRQ